MGTSFDDRAKAAAVRSPGVAGLSRRQLIQRGALVVGTAWTAPMLLSATPAWAGASICGGNLPVYSTCPSPSVQKICCPSGQTCVLDLKGNYVCDIGVGGICGNNGNGQCDGGYSRCNHLHVPSICGGPGAYCDYNNNAVCISTSPCFPKVGVSGSRCGGEGAPCSSTTDCASGSTGPTGTTAADLVCIGATGTTKGTCLVKV